MEKQQFPVYESNEFIRKVKVGASKQALNCLFYIASQIKSKDYLADYKAKNGSYPLDVWFNLADMRDAMGIEKNGKNNADLKACLESLKKPLFWQTVMIPSEDGTEMWEAEECVSVLDAVYIVGKQNRVKVTFSTTMIPYFYELEQFTKTELKQLYSLENKEMYSTLLYRLCKSYQGMGIFSISLEQFKLLCGVENSKSYERFPDFRRYVLESAISDINKNTDINVTYTAKKTKGSRSYNTLTFTVHSKLNPKAQEDLEKALSDVDKTKNDWIMRRQSELFTAWLRDALNNNRAIPADLESKKNEFLPQAMKDWKEHQKEAKKETYDKFYKKKGK